MNELEDLKLKDEPEDIEYQKASCQCCGGFHWLRCPKGHLREFKSSHMVDCRKCKQVRQARYRAKYRAKLRWKQRNLVV